MSTSAISHEHTCRMDTSLSRPIPVSTCFAGRSLSVPASSRLNCHSSSGANRSKHREREKENALAGGVFCGAKSLSRRTTEHFSHPKGPARCGKRVAQAVTILYFVFSGNIGLCRGASGSDELSLSPIQPVTVRSPPAIPRLYLEPEGTEYASVDITLSPSSKPCFPSDLGRS